MALHTCISEQPVFYSWANKSYKPTHPAVAMSTSLNPDLFLWAWSLRARDVQDTSEIWALNIYSENGTWSALKILPSVCRDASKQCNIIGCQGSDLSCQVTGPHAAVACITISSFGITRSAPRHALSPLPALLASQELTPNTEPMQGCYCHAAQPPPWAQWTWKQGPGILAKDVAKSSVPPLPFNHYCSAELFHVLVKTRSASSFPPDTLSFH